MRRTAICIVSLALVVAGSGFAQQITTVAVIDLAKVLQSFYRESSAVRELQKMRDDIQKSLENLNKELTQLQEQKLVAETDEDGQAILRLENEIFLKKQYIQEYRKIKNAQLQTMAASLSDSSSFLSEVLRAVEAVSLNNGYSIVHDVSDSNSTVLWYSKVIDITEDVIQRLVRSSR